jgi:linoleate 10R-lipoxygenase
MFELKHLFRSLTRDSHGKFPDEEITRIIQDSTESPGGQFRARGTPEALRIIEILTIEQA